MACARKTGQQIFLATQRLDTIRRTNTPLFPAGHIGPIKLISIPFSPLQMVQAIPVWQQYPGKLAVYANTGDMSLSRHSPALFHRRSDYLQIFCDLPRTILQLFDGNLFQSHCRWGVNQTRGAARFSRTAIIKNQMRGETAFVNS